MITSPDWTKAEDHLSSMEETCKELSGMPGVNMMFYGGLLAGLRGRFDKGERTGSLHREIMEME